MSTVSQFLKEIKTKSLREIIFFLQEKNLIHKFRICKCKSVMKLVERKDINDGWRWRCNKSTCRKSVSLRKNTFFDYFTKSLEFILTAIFHWAIQSRQIDQSHFLEVSRNTIVKLQKVVRLSIASALDKSNFQLGGEGCVVEIDESLFIKVKHHRGKDLKRPQVWVFGLYERNTKKCFFVKVPKRDNK